ncbi:MAG: glycosidase [Spirochaetes bacterium]|nr:glycosidase [Spirochaetota bacterium]
MNITRCSENPIIWPGKWDWRMSNAYNPAVMYENGKFYLFERTAGSMRPHHCYVGLLKSDDGVHFTHMSDKPVFSPEMVGYKYGSVQDPRVVKIGDTYYMTFAFRRFAWNIFPTGLGAPDASQGDFPGFDPSTDKNQTRSGIAISKDMLHWEFSGWATPAEVDDRDVILFPEKINGKFALLRRPIGYVDLSTGHSEEHPSIRISYSDDLKNWSDPNVLIQPEFAWEDNRIGGSTPPIRTDKGWLVLYHGVENTNPATRRVIYRMGALLLDLGNPGKVIARAADFIMEPEAYYEKFGAFIPNVIFPTGAVVVNDILWIYYGCCDTSIGLATVPLSELLDHIIATSFRKSAPPKEVKND